MSRSRVITFVVIAMGALLAGLVAYRFLPVSPSRTIALQEEFDAKAYDKYPLVSLGNEFEGLGRTSVIYKPVQGGTSRPSSESVTFVYGDCEVSGLEGSCPVPLQVTVLPGCTPDVPEWMKTQAIEVRGVSAEYYGTPGHMLLDLGSVKVIIISSEATNEESDQRARRAAAALRGENAMASSITVTSDLTAVPERDSLAFETLCSVPE